MVALVIALVAAVLAPAPRADAATATEAAVQQILADTNKIRTDRGLRPLVLNAQMTTVAQNWTQSLWNRNVLAHNPNYTSQIPSGWTRAAENVAAGYTVSGVVQGWKGSQGHYENMIGDYTDIGIGVVVSGGRSFFTQNFAKYSRPVEPPLDVDVDRVGGADRYQVAIGISQRSQPGTSQVVYVATGSNFPDALSAAAAAAADDAPLLLTPGTALRSDVAAEIRRLSPAKIVVVGGAAVVSNAVVDALRAIQPNTVRVAGDDRYAGSRALLRYAFPAKVSTVYIATGASFPDALSASAAAGTTGSPVLLVKGTAAGLDTSTRNALVAADPDRIIIVGGTGAVSAGIERDLKSIATTVRLGGSTRYQTSLAVTKSAFSTADRVFLATGTDFPDALGGSAWGGALPGPLLVVPKSCIPWSTMEALRSLGPDRITLLGGTGALTSNVARLATC